MLLIFSWLGIHIYIFFHGVCVRFAIRWDQREECVNELLPLLCCCWWWYSPLDCRMIGYSLRKTDSLDWCWWCPYSATARCCIVIFKWAVDSLACWRSPVLSSTSYIWCRIKGGERTGLRAGIIESWCATLTDGGGGGMTTDGVANTWTGWQKLTLMVTYEQKINYDFIDQFIFMNWFLLDEEVEMIDYLMSGRDHESYSSRLTSARNKCPSDEGRKWERYPVKESEWPPEEIEADRPRPSPDASARFVNQGLRDQPLKPS